MKGPRQARQAQAGFTYLWLLIFIALQGAALSVLAPLASSQARREMETELLFRGTLISQALEAFASASPAGEHCRPQSLYELLEDRRSGDLKRHLRRVYEDPFSGQPDWELERDLKGGIVRLHSKVKTPALRSLDIRREDGKTPLVSDRFFKGGGQC